MMKIVLIEMVFLLSVCQLFASKVPAFKNGKRYIYKYKGIVTNGISDDDTLSGFGITAKVLVQNDNNDVVMQITEPMIGTFSGLLQQDIGKSLVYSNSNDTTMAGKLQKPFWVEYDNGVIKAIKFDKTDKTPQRNFKKALAALFQTNIKANGDQLPSYKVKENGIGGMCDTLYKIDAKAGLMNVTKIRDYENCEYRSYLQQTTYIGAECKGSNQQNWEPVSTFSETKYNINGTQDDFTIENIQSYGAIVFTLFMNQTNTTVSIVNQTLDLESVVVSTPINKPIILEKVNSLAYTFEINYSEPEDLKQSNYKNKIKDKEYPQRMKQAENLWKEVKTVMKNVTIKPNVVASLVNIFQKFSYNELMQFFNKQVNNEKNYIKNLYFDIVSLTGTNPSVIFVLTMIESGGIPKVEAYKLLQKISFHISEPSVKLISWIKLFVAKKAITDNSLLYTESLIFYGKTIFHACKDQYYQSNPTDSKSYINAKKCSTLIQELIDYYQTIKDDTLRSMYVKAIGNTGTETAFEYLTKIINDKKGSNVLRQEAVKIIQIYNGDKYNEKVQSILTSVYDDETEDNATRINALEALLHITPNFMKYFDHEFANDSVNNESSVHNGTQGLVGFIYMVNNSRNIRTDQYISQPIHVIGKCFNFYEIACTIQENQVDVLLDEQTTLLLGKILNYTILTGIMDKLGLKHSGSRKMNNSEISMRVFNQDVLVTKDIGDTDTSQSINVDIKDSLFNIYVHSVEELTSKHLLPNEMGFLVSFLGEVPLSYHIEGKTPLITKDDSIHTNGSISADFNLSTVVDFSMYSHLSVEDTILNTNPEAEADPVTSVTEDDQIEVKLNVDNNSPVIDINSIIKW